MRYAWRRHAVRADLAGDRDDGERGERDLIGADVEGITGGGNDRLSGNDERNRLEGDHGGTSSRDAAARTRSSRCGSGGDSDVSTDRLYGGDGSDELFGSDGDNVVDGGPAADRPLRETRPRPCACARRRRRPGHLRKGAPTRRPTTRSTSSFAVSEPTPASESPAVPAVAATYGEDSRAGRRRTCSSAASSAAGEACPAALSSSSSPVANPATGDRLHEPAADTGRGRARSDPASADRSASWRPCPLARPARAHRLTTCSRPPACWSPSRS